MWARLRLLHPLTLSDGEGGHCGHVDPRTLSACGLTCSGAGGVYQWRGSRQLNGLEVIISVVETQVINPKAVRRVCPTGRWHCRVPG